MTEYDNTNRSAIWGRKARDGDVAGKKYPTHTGSINFEGIECYLDGWTRQPGSHPDAPAMSFTIKRKQPKTETAKPTQTISDEMSDEIPF